MTNDLSRKGSLNLSLLRARLEGSQGRQYWRSLEELADTEEFQDFLHNEFPQQFAAWSETVDRRQMLKLMGASLALAGLSGCTRQPNEKIVPYVRAPEQIVPGKPLFFATAMPLGGFASGLLVESHMGRPTKIEGNPQHPASLGATDLFAQASVLTLYDPDRSQVVTRLGQISSWVAFAAALRTTMDNQRPEKGARLRILTGTVTSPTLAHQMRSLLAEFPAAKWIQYEPAGSDMARAGAQLAFGEYVNTVYRFDQADLILSLDADFLGEGPGHLRYTRQFTARRQVQAEAAGMNRLYAVESTLSNTGAMADHRLRMRAGEIERFARAVANELGVKTEESGAEADQQGHTQWVTALARDLQKHRGSSIVLAGNQQPPSVHALANALNHVLGNVGKTVVYTDPVEADPGDQLASVRELVRDMEAGQVDLLVIADSNPVFTAPADLRFAEHLLKVKRRIHLGLYQDETSTLCHWHVPQAHYLESWSDARAFDGTVTILQPLIAPLYDGKSIHQLLSALSGKPQRSSHDIVRDYWKSQNPPGNFDELWRTALHDGLLAGTALPPKRVSLKADFLRVGKGTEAPTPRTAAGETAESRGLEIVFRPDPTIWDGRFANNGWLQELPKPLTKLTWDNAALVSPATAERLGLANEELVELHYRDRVVRAPVWIQPGHADDSVTVHLGYGRTRAGRVGTGTGFNAYALRGSDRPWFDSGLVVRKTGGRYPLSSTQIHHNMEGRHLVRVGTLEEFQHNPHFAHEVEHGTAPHLSLFPEHKYEGYAWGMAIDLNRCVGCNACVVACQAENNIPVVGKVEVARGREMHWLRIDRYYSPSLENPEVYHQPVMCMHCENAPCEVVCPVAATVHSSEGLNEMVYNRCVGTRYCSNNCPYKVRRFNFFAYSDYDTPVLKLLRNPDVTVRTRGVMEKCTYCVQRINVARIEAKKEDREIRDGEIVTACQAACPAQAITFGDINDPQSRVSQLKAEPRNYGLLEDLNTRPRTTYLAKLRNPNPELEGK